MQNPLHPRLRDSPPLPIRTYPKLGVHALLRDEFAGEDVPEKEVVVHRFDDYFCDGEGGELEEAVVF